MTRTGPICRSLCGVLLPAIGLLLAHPATVAADPGSIDFQKDIEPLLESYCFDCHGDGMDRGNLELDLYRQDPRLLHDTDTWLAVWRKMDSGLMPPPKKSQPTPEERRRVQEWIKWQAFQLDPDQPDPGRVTVRRLNRVEYENTIRDWLGVDYDTTENFPPDDTGYGFDTIGDTLGLSPLLMEKYMEAAQDITAAFLEKATPRIPVAALGGNRLKEVDDGSRDGRRLPLAEAATVSATHQVKHPGEYWIRLEHRTSGSEDATDETAMLYLGVNGVEVEHQTAGWDQRRRIVLGHKASLNKGPNHLALRVEPREPLQPGESHLFLEIARVRIEGPMDRSHLSRSPQYHMMYPDGPPPDDPAGRDVYARKILRALAERAYRRPVDEETVDRLLEISHDASEGAEVTFDDRIGYGLTAMLCSPRFLFRAEFQPDPDNREKVVLIDEFALASRLSYFLWSTLPDEELLQLAQSGKLRDELGVQVDRMLSDARTDRFIENFVGQWLQTRDVEGMAMDSRRILGIRSSREAEKVFSRSVQSAMRRETEMFFADLIRSNGQLTDLLTARYTFLNEPLAKFYGVEGVTGQEMRKVELPDDSPRGGLLTQGSFLVVTSNPTRTSPVKRGQFILDNLLGMPAPPPPPDVPELEEAKQGKKGPVTMRELMVVHREDPLCFSCHALMDPPGLAFERFNAIGYYREDDRGQPIQTDGKLATGETFTDHADLARQLATSRRHDLYRCVTEKMLTYAIGRGLEYYDVPTIDEIVAKLELDGGRTQTLIRAVIDSPAFQMRRGSDNLTARAGMMIDQP